MRAAWIHLLSLALATRAAAALPASQPATQPAGASVLTDRQASILMQLADAEANIAAINKALVRTGYKVGLAYDQKEGAEKANEMMDRKGGGPVPWDQFYGKSAVDFYHHASADVAVNIGRGAAVGEAHWTGSRLTRVDRPPQFDFIYRAHTQQTAAAQQQIATLLQDQAALLARRQKHELDQSALWATYAFERVADREIAFRPIYRFKLKPAGREAELIRGPILFLRATDKALSDALENMNRDQPAAYASLRKATKDAYDALKASMADALLSESLKPNERSDAEAIKALCKRVVEECVIADDNDRRAAESDAAKEDSSKLQYRSELQSSLSKMAGAVGALDDALVTAARDWSLAADAGVSSADKVATTPTAVAATAPTSPPSVNVGKSDGGDARVAGLRTLFAHPATATPVAISNGEPLIGDTTWAATPNGYAI